jgi:hypothetical protein
LAKDKVDKVVDIKTDLEISGTYYLHSPVWFLAYEYKGKRFQVIMDGASGQIVTGDLPGENFNLV